MKNVSISSAAKTPCSCIQNNRAPAQVPGVLFLWYTIQKDIVRGGDYMLQPHKVGMAVGAGFGLLHAGWSLLVSIGLAQPLLDFMLSLHFFNLSYSLDAFSFINAILLVVITSLIGYVDGFVFSKLWNWMSK